MAGSVRPSWVRTFRRADDAFLSAEGGDFRLLVVFRLLIAQGAGDSREVFRKDIDFPHL
jgi:hypothetical protein